ncbi:ras and EF-hand domain-containing protein isoform X3 [Tachysurus fulvidraco]|uniref:ras and EF-hand domain-containing protein isoform X3 n=1 Tax=Tachysurus fulvidraco TaxID=1234273 RepID=UPI000F509BF5|nr:ras and EF-hand domain-containing protein isoform X3 [Tachysurus fulvidraco]
MGFCLRDESVRLMESGACDEASLRALFRACDLDNSGLIEKWEFEQMCSELRVHSADIDDIFTKLDTNQDGAINMNEFIHGFQTATRLSSDGGTSERVKCAEPFTQAWEEFRTRLGELNKFIPRIDQVSTLYQNISLTDTRMIPQYEKVLLNFSSEIKLQNKEMERLALAVKRAQDQAAIQLSAMEEEMDQRIHTTEKNTRMEEFKKAEAALSIMKEQYEAQLSELRQKVLTLQMFEDQNKGTGLREENVALKRKNNELTLQNQKLKQDLLESLTNIALLQSELDSLKSDITDQSINLERDEALMRSFSEDRDNLERLANRKLHDTNDGLRMTLENRQSKNGNQGGCGRSPSSTISGTKSMCESRCYRDDGYEQLRIAEYLQTPSRDSLALALCDPMCKHRSCEVDSLDESCVDSGMSTLRSNNGYDSEQEGTGHSHDALMANFSCSGDTSDTEVPDVRDKTGYESDSESIMDMTSNPGDTKDVSASGKKCLSAIFDEKPKDKMEVMAQRSEKTYNIVLAGDAAVGKSSFLLRLCKNEFKGFTSTTLGVDFQMKTLVVDGAPTVLQLWDTAGQERFKSIAKSYFRRADGVLLLYDVTCEKSFLNVREWVDTIEDVSQDKIPIMLVGNKTDLRQQALHDGVTCISTSYGEKLARTYSSLFCETSAKDGSNIIEAVLHLAREVIKHAHERKGSTLGQILSGSSNTKLTNSKCCRV